MDYGQLVIMHLTTTTPRQGRGADGEDLYYRTHDRGGLRSWLPRWRLAGVLTFFGRISHRQPVRVAAR